MMRIYHLALFEIGERAVQPPDGPVCEPGRHIFGDVRLTDTFAHQAVCNSHRVLLIIEIEEVAVELHKEPDERPEPHIVHSLGFDQSTV